MPLEDRIAAINPGFPLKMQGQRGPHSLKATVLSVLGSYYFRI